MRFFEKPLFLIPIVFGLIVIAGFVANPTYSVWVDRDLLRAYEMFEFFPVMGAELNGTYYARTPGGAYYYILGLLSVISNDPDVISRFLIVLSISGAVAIYFAAARICGEISGLVAAGLWLTSPLVLGAGFQIINPALGIPISGFCYLLFVRYFQAERYALLWLAALLGILIQIHISYLALTIIFGISILLFRRPRWRVGVASLVTLVLTFTPYIVAEIINGFVNTRLLILGQNDPNPIYTSVKLSSLDYFFRRITQPVLGMEDMAYMGAAVVFVLISSFIFVVAARHLSFLFGRGAEFKNDRVFLGLATILAAGIVMIAWGRGFGQQPRYFVFLVPAIALLMAGVTASALNWISERHPGKLQSGYLATALLLIFLSSGQAWRAYEFLNRTEDSQSQAEILSSHIRAVKRFAEYGREEINRRVVVVGEDGKLLENYASYLAETVDTSVRGKVLAKPSCVAVITTPDPARSVQAFEAFMKSMPLEPINTALLGRDADQSLFAYALENENCYKSLGNSYDHLTQERIARERCDEAQSDGIIWWRQNEKGLQLVVRDTFDRSRLCFLIDMMQAGNQIVGTIYSWQGRAYSGYPISQWSFWNIDMEFSQAGWSVTSPLATTPLALFKSRYVGHMPWNFSIEAPPGGKYDLAVKYTLEHHMDFQVEGHGDTAPKHMARYQLDVPFTIAE